MSQAATVTSLGSFIPSGLNNQGVVVGDIVDFNAENLVGHAGVWANGTLTPLPERSGTQESDAFAVSESGRIVGLEYVDNNNVHALRWEGVAPPAQIGPLASLGYDFSVAEDVDFAGNVVGTTLGASPHGQLGFYAPAGGSPVAVGVANLDPDAGGTSVGAISGDGTTMLGQVGGTDNADGVYLWSTANPAGPGIKIDLTPARSPFPLLGGSIYNVRQWQNSLASDGSVLGYRESPRLYFVRTPNGAETQVVGLTGHNAINGSHDVAGTIATGDPEDPVHAAMWDAQTQTVVDLNTLLPPNSGFLLFSAIAINDHGDIVGVAAHDNAEVGFLLRTNLSVTIASDPPDPVVGTDFQVVITVTNTLAAPIHDVTPPAALTVAGEGEATRLSGPTPPVRATLAPGAAVEFSYTYRATKQGAVVLTGDVHATDDGGPIVATARCALGASTLARSHVTAGETCPVDGNGAAVTISLCKLKLHDDSDALRLPRLGAAPDKVPPPEDHYPSGGT